MCDWLSDHIKYGKTGNNKMQLVMQQRCKTSWTAVLRVLPALSDLSYNKSGSYRFESG